MKTQTTAHINMYTLNRKKKVYTEHITNITVGLEFLYEERIVNEWTNNFSHI